MLRNHPSTEDLERLPAGRIPAGSRRSQRGDPAPSARLLCGVSRPVDALGWSGARLEHLVYLPGGRHEDETDKARTGKGYNYDRAFARAGQVVDEFLAAVPPSQISVAELLADLDRRSPEVRLALAEADERFAVPQLVQALIERSHAIRYDDPEAMLHWARLARSIASRVPAEALGGSTRLARPASARLGAVRQRPAGQQPVARGGERADHRAPVPGGGVRRSGAAGAAAGADRLALHVPAALRRGRLRAQ